jgi:hypothetical protein
MHHVEAFVFKRRLNARCLRQTVAAFARLLARVRRIAKIEWTSMSNRIALFLHFRETSP